MFALMMSVGLLTALVATGLHVIHNSTPTPYPTEFLPGVALLWGTMAVAFATSDGFLKAVGCCAISYAAGGMHLHRQASMRRRAELFAERL